MIEQIPLRQIPAQSLMAVLDGQACSLRIVRRNGLTYCDLVVDQRYIWYGLVCHDRTPLKQFRVTPLRGDFVFVDNEGGEDPHYSGFGVRFNLFYFSDDEALPESFQIRGSRV